MAKASRKKFGVGSQGKSAGTGAMTEIPAGVIGENMVLSNRDKSGHSESRGLDSKEVQNEQLQDQPQNRQGNTR